MTASDLIAFEKEVQQLWEAGELPYLTHLCGGNEEDLIGIFNSIRPEDYVFVSHRAHYHWLLKGDTGRVPIDAHREELLAEIKAGRSMFLYSRLLKLVASAIVAGNCCIAAGTAWALKRKGSKSQVFCFLGDGAEDQGHFAEAVRWVEAQELPCTFLIEDNDRSCSVSMEQRWGKPYRQDWPGCVIRIRYTQTWPHAGSGCKHHIEFKTK